jgi:hypothetical protein
MFSGSVRGSSSNLLSVEDADDEMVPPFKVTPSEPAKRGRFYTLGLGVLHFYSVYLLLSSHSIFKLTNKQDLHISGPSRT